MPTYRYGPFGALITDDFDKEETTQKIQHKIENEPHKPSRYEWCKCGKVFGDHPRKGCFGFELAKWEDLYSADRDRWIAAYYGTSLENIERGVF